MRIGEILVRMKVLTTEQVEAVLAEQAARRHVATVRTAAGCSRCHQDRYFSHRGGDAGRMLGIIALS